MPRSSLACPQGARVGLIYQAQLPGCVVSPRPLSLTPPLSLPETGLECRRRRTL